MPIHSPIIVYENGDVIIFDSVAEAELAIEPIDALNGEYVFYDATGLQLRVEVTDVSSNVGWFKRTFWPPVQRVKLVASENRNCSEDLADMLRGFLVRLGPDLSGVDDEEIEALSLGQLVAATSIALHR